jgi:polyhydroxybutyrate depolymerase
MLRAVAALLAIALPPASAFAADCGGPDAPCEIDGGFYHIVAPEGPGPHPAVIFLHGYGGLADASIANEGLVRPFLDRGYAVIAPQGMPRRQGRRGGSWNAFASPTRRNDVDFIRAAVADAARRFGLDRDRIVATGFSGGGMMVWRIACDAPEDYAAYAPVAGLLWRPLPAHCAGPVRMLHTHGWTDPVVPIEGRAVAGGRITQGDLFAGLNLLREAGGCLRDDPDVTAAKGDFWLRQWSDCAEGASLEFALHPGGHAIPKGWSTMVLDWFEGFRPATQAVCRTAGETAETC